MKLKRQPRPQPRRAARTSRQSGALAARQPRGRQASRPGIPLRRRLGERLPSIRRLLAGLGAAAVAAGLVALLGGPWLRVTDVTWAGEQFTAQRELARLLDRQRGTSVLAVDTRSLRERLERLPAVAEATVVASLTGRLEVTIVERETAFIWETSSARLLGAADGTLFAALPRDAPLDADAGGDAAHLRRALDGAPDDGRGSDSRRPAAHRPSPCEPRSGDARARAPSG